MTAVDEIPLKEFYQFTIDRIWRLLILAMVGCVVGLGLSFNAQQSLSVKITISHGLQITKDNEFLRIVYRTQAFQWLKLQKIQGLLPADYFFDERDITWEFRSTNHNQLIGFTQDFGNRLHGQVKENLQVYWTNKFKEATSKNEDAKRLLPYFSGSAESVWANHFLTSAQQMRTAELAIQELQDQRFQPRLNISSAEVKNISPLYLVPLMGISLPTFAFSILCFFRFPTSYKKIK